MGTPCTVNIHYFVWKLLNTIYKFSSIHLPDAHPPPPPQFKFWFTANSMAVHKQTGWTFLSWQAKWGYVHCSAHMLKMLYTFRPYCTQLCKNLLTHQLVQTEICAYYYNNDKTCMAVLFLKKTTQEPLNTHTHAYTPKRKKSKKSILKKCLHGRRWIKFMNEKKMLLWSWQLG